MKTLAMFLMLWCLPSMIWLAQALLRDWLATRAYRDRNLA